MKTTAPSKRTIQRRLKELRTLVDTSSDPAVRSVAYAMEGAITWATSKTVGWPAPAREAVMIAELLKQELAE